MLSKKVKMLTQMKSMLDNIEESRNTVKLQHYLKKLNLDESMIQNKHEIMKHKEFIMSKIKKGLSYYKHKSQSGIFRNRKRREDFK